MYGWANKSMKNSEAKIQELKEAKRCDLNNWDYFFHSCIYPFWYKLISVNSLLLTNNNSFKIANILKTAVSVRYWTEFCQTKQTKTGVQVRVSIDIELGGPKQSERVRESRFINVITSQFPQVNNYRKQQFWRTLWYKTENFQSSQQWPRKAEHIWASSSTQQIQESLSVNTNLSSVCMLKMNNVSISTH